ncbi:uncharacterized protein LOC111249297 isoform X2 [Varroa destructor]|nr:uncharacterized protein LOC111249297 isoform X2 [Varroa destructor]XP_022658710.1 uncharacterized protein LOC111249297 isoform X2 [Varroa destructor]XP_022658711.1 uncharacterized protein LOC111249297 isoform X2 [Varroa destructor]
MSAEEQGLILLTEIEKCDLGPKEEMAIMEHLSRRFGRVVNSTSYLQLTIEQVKKLLGYLSIRKIYGPDVLYRAAMRWLHADCRVRQQFTEEILNAAGLNKAGGLSSTLVLSICPTIAKEVTYTTAGDFETATKSLHGKHRKPVEVACNGRSTGNANVAPSKIPRSTSKSKELITGQHPEYSSEDGTEHSVKRRRHKKLINRGKGVNCDTATRDKINLIRNVGDRIKKLVKPTSEVRSKGTLRSLKVSAPPPIKIEGSRKISPVLPVSGEAKRNKECNMMVMAPSNTSAARVSFVEKKSRRSKQSLTHQGLPNSCRQQGDHFRSSCGHCRCYKEPRSRHPDEKHHLIRTTSKTMTRAPPPSIESLNKTCLKSILKRSKITGSKGKSRKNSKRRHHRVILSDISPAPFASSISSQDSYNKLTCSRSDRKRHLWQAKIDPQHDIK